MSGIGDTPWTLDRMAGLVRYVRRRFGEDRCLAKASSLSYTSLLALVPLSAIAFAMLAAFPVFADVREDLQDMMFANLLPSSAQATREYFEQFIRNASSLTAVGIIGLALTAVLLLGSIESSLNAIFRVRQPRALAPRLLVFWALITVGPLLLGASFSISTYLFALSEWMGVAAIEGVGGLLAETAPTLLIIGALALFYAITPNRPVHWRNALVGGGLAGLLFTGLRGLFGFYVSHFPTYQTIYGAVSAVPIFLVWMYLSWAVVLLGAVVTASLSEWRAIEEKAGERRLRGLTRLMVAMEILVLLRRARDDGAAVAPARLSKEIGIGDAATDRLLEQLRGARLVERTDNQEWILSRDLATVTLDQLLAILGIGFHDWTPSGPGETWKERLGERLRDLAGSQGAIGAISLEDLLTPEGDAPKTKTETVS